MILSNQINDPLLILAIGISFVVIGIMVLRLHAFLSLLLGTFVVAILTSDSSIIQYLISKGISIAEANNIANQKVGERIAIEFGRTCGKIGILIAMASIIGKTMLQSGAAERIVRSMLKFTGNKNAPLTFLGSSFFIGIPVFFDTVFYLMLPLAKTTTVKLGKNYLLLVLCIIAGAAMANSLIPPTPGPLFLISELNIPIGMMMIAGFLVGSICIIAGYFFAVWANMKWPINLRNSIDGSLKEIKKISQREEKSLPPLFFSLLPILVPIILITGKALIDTFLNFNDILLSPLFSYLYLFIDFFGEKNIALITGALSSLILLAVQKNNDTKFLSSSVYDAIMSAGVIILITSAGGAFGAILQQTGISIRIGELTKDYQMALIPLAFFITAVVRTAQGSATVAMITSSGILAGMATSISLDYHQLYIGLAIACGSKLIPWMNDSGFWIICKMSDLTEKEVLKTFSPMLSIMGLVGLIVVLVSAKLFPLI